MDEPCREGGGGVPADAAGARTVLVVHIPKTGGSTLNWVLRRQLDPADCVLVRRGRFDLLDLPPDEALALVRPGVTPRVVSAHMSFGLHEALDWPCTYLAFVRRPVPRVLSAYRHLRQDRRSPLHEAARSTSLPELLAGGRLLDADNGQVRRLSGVGGTLPLGGCTRETLRQAIDNVDRHFALVGTTERFDESVLLAADVVGLDRPYYWAQNRGKGGATAAPADTATVAAVAEHNALDQELYDYVADRLDARVRDLGAPFRRSARSFAVANRRWFPVRDLPHRVAAKVRYEASRRPRGGATRA